jgi:peptidylprolyl isomerase
VSPQPPVPIRSMRVASDLPQAERTPIEVLRTDSATFRSVLEQRRNRRDPWFKFNPGHIDLCNVPLPVRLGSSPGR